MNSLYYLLITVASLAVLQVLNIIILRKFGNSIIENIGQGLNTVMGSENVKRAMSIIGKQGGNAKAVNAIKDKMAKGFINKNYGLIKIVAERLGGIDVDELIDDYGAENILSAVQQLAPQLGFDINAFLSGQNINTTNFKGYPKEE